MRSNVGTEINPVSRLCDIWWSLCSSCFSWKMHACHPWNPMPSVWQWCYHTLTRSVGTGDRSMHVSPWPHDRLWSRIFSCPREHRSEKRLKLPSVLGSIIQGVAGQEETLLMSVVRWNKGISVQGVLHESGSDLQISSWVMLMADGCVWVSVLLRRGRVSSWILRGPFVSRMLFSSSVSIT